MRGWLEKKRNRMYAPAGFALIEVLIIVAIVSLGVIPVIGLLSHTAQRVSFNEERVTANLRAVQIIERYRKTAFAELKTRFSSETNAASLMQSDPILRMIWVDDPINDKSRSFLEQFNVKVVFEPDSGAPDKLGVLTCTVEWEDNKGTEHIETRHLIVENTDL